MVLQAGKIYTPKTAAEPRDDFLTDVRLEARKYANEDEVDRLTRPDTDWFILASALGNMAMLQYANISRADEDSDVLTATGEALERIRESLGVPEAPPSPSSGSIIVTYGPGTATLNDHEFVMPNGKRGRVDGVQFLPDFTSGADDTYEVPVIAIDTGVDTNLGPGAVVQFVSPPTGVHVEATVSTNDPLTGGSDGETIGDPIDDERKRDRILNRLQNVPAGGNWGYIVEKSFEALSSIQYTFVYPALGGPGSAKVAIIRDFDIANNDYSRAFSSVSAINLVKDYLQASLPSPMEIPVTTVADESVDVAIALTLPDSSLSGGDGSGWVDAAVWPPLEGGDTRVSVTNILTTDGAQIRVNASTTTSPVAGQTHIAWWSSEDQKFHTRLVIAVAGGTGAWDLTLDAPLVDHNNAIVQVGEYISPAAVNIVEYGKEWLNQMRRLGPGELTNDANRLPRAARHPFVSEDWPSDLTVRQLLGLVDKHSEIQDAAWSYRSLTSPTLPVSITLSPNVLVPQHFGVYKQ